MYSEDDLLPLSGLQHLAFCERQWALIHLEQQWEENRWTAEGRLMHNKADEGPDESRNGIRILRALPLRCFRLGLSGKADVVEFPLEGGDPPYPIEYKRGSPKKDNWDEIQLCAQALCLEEMLHVRVPVGALFYGETRRRSEVQFEVDLRQQTEELARRMHQIHASGQTPAPHFTPRCRKCSLLEICQPRAIEQRGSAALFLRRSLQLHLMGEDAE